MGRPGPGTTMRDGWPAWAQDAWRSMSLEERERARTVWSVLAGAFEGALVGPGPLVRHLVDEGRMGHRSTMETLGLLVEHGLVHTRPAAEGTIVWIPEALMPTEDQGRGRPRPRFAATRRSNGSASRARASA